MKLCVLSLENVESLTRPRHSISLLRRALRHFRTPNGIGMPTTTLCSPSAGIGHDGVPLPIYDEQEEDVGISEVDLDLEPEGLHEGDALGYKKKRKQNKQKHGKKQKLKAKDRAADHSRDPIARALLRR